MLLLEEKLSPKVTDEVFFFTPLRFGSSLVSFPFLFALAIFIGVLINYTVAVTALYK